MARVDTRFTFFQAPVRVEDALGRVWPVPSEYSMDDLQAILLSKFIGQPGHGEIEAGNYEVINQQDSRQAITANHALTPGMNIVVAIVMQSVVGRDEVCPVTSCQSKETIEMLSGGRKW
jgi:hypothetical protein